MAREPGVALLMTASGSLDIFLTRLLRMKSLQNHQQRHAAPEVALTVRSMLLKRKSRDLPLFKIVYCCLKMHTIVSKLVALSAEKYYIVLTDVQLKNVGAMTPLSKQVPDPYHKQKARSRPCLANSKVVRESSQRVHAFVNCSSLEVERVYVWFLTSW